MLSISPRLLLGPLSCCCCYPGRLFWHLSLSTLSGIAVSAVVIVMITDSLKPSLLSISALSVVAVWSLTLTPSQLPISILSGVAISAVDVDVVADRDAFTAVYFCSVCCCCLVADSDTFTTFYFCSVCCCCLVADSDTFTATYVYPVRCCYFCC